MTGDLLQSDVEYARRLLREGQSGERVVEALCLRRVNPVKARAAVRDLAAGFDVRGNDLDAPELYAAVIRPLSSSIPSQSEKIQSFQQEQPEPIVAKPRSSAFSVQENPIVSRSAVAIQPVVHAPPEPVVGGPSSVSHKSNWLWIGAIAICAMGAGVWMWTNQRPKIHATTRETTKAPDLKLSVPEMTLRRRTPGVQIQAGKVSIGGVELRAQNAFSQLNQALGAPSRTNKLDGLALYTYDDHGIVLYSSDGKGKDSLVIYLEPMGGTNGVQKAFSGVLNVEGKLIMAASDRVDISQVPHLALKETVSNVFAGQCGQLGISFAYLKGADQLTMVQVDLN